MVDLILSPEELVILTGYRRASDQLAELHRQGFCRARRDRLGNVILERAHYEAVCSMQPGAVLATKPKVKLLAKAPA
ncbi:MAG: DUF4224 domain-containing protein [Caldimonas manganoxidans]|jgi:hypothetical protein|uniref:DUF4224 domain-containing protein n=1 Tax=Caldimonas taiwanensis TaxID=307483 RepID=UPI0007847669|nr:DUF4224 domain-containing protein [Caldimonas taiwanensis]MCX7660864.1 DUF4224 domain-containing protein [Caldimonas manganoxidans]